MNKLFIPINPDDKKYYLDGKINFQGIPIKVENWKGSFREGIDENGKKWRSVLTCPYGYINKVIMQSDKDHLDVFVGNNYDSNNVYVVKQINPKTKKFDEYKVILGCDNLQEAKDLYFSNYNTKKHFHSIKELTMKDFKEKIDKNIITENDFEKSFGLFIDLEKANVKGHLRKTKKGKMTLVKQHTANVGRKKKGVQAKNPWIKKFGSLKLNRFPDKDVKLKDVKIDLEGDIHSKAVLVWKDSKSGNLIHAYTKEYMDKKNEEKQKRISNLLNESKIKKLKNIALKMLDDPKQRRQQSAAILYIAAETGLRVGGKRLLEKTGNKGLTTMSPDNLQIDGDLIKIDFRGKKYVNNKGIVKNKKLADYLRKLKEQRKDEKTLFTVQHFDVGWYLKKWLGNKDLKTKDLRTYYSNKLANEIIRKIKFDNLPESKTAKKKAVKQKLNEVFKQVSEKLNNTPGVAKTSYVNPQIINNWLKQNKVDKILAKSEIDELAKANKIIFDLDEIINEHKNLVKRLKNKKGLKDVYSEQKKELEEYEKMKNFKKKIVEEKDFEKAHVKSYIKKTKTGKLINVKDYENKKLKKIPIGAWKNIKDPKQKASALAYMIVTGREDESQWTKELWNNLNDKIKESYLKIMDEPILEKIKIDKDGFKTITLMLPNIGKAKVTFKYEGGYYPSTQWEPAVYPELNIKKLVLLDEKNKQVDLDELSNEDFDEIDTAIQNHPLIKREREEEDRREYEEMKRLERLDLEIDGFKIGQKVKIKKEYSGGSGIIKDFDPSKKYAVVETKNKKVKYVSISDLLKSELNELQLFINLEKSHVKDHTRTSKTGKIIQVKDYENKKIKNEKQNYTIYHNSFYSACNEAKNLVEKNGYQINEDDWFNEVTTRYKAKPDIGNISKFSIQLEKDGKPINKYLQMQIYGLQNGKYELNAYIQSGVTKDEFKKGNINLQDNELRLFIDIEKAHVRAHTRRSKTGKLENVRDFENRVQKKNIVKKEPVRFKKKEEYEKMKMEKEKQEKLVNTNFVPEIAGLEKEKIQLEFMLKKYPELINTEKINERIKQLVDAKRKIEDILIETSSGKGSLGNFENTEKENKEKIVDKKNDEGGDEEEWKKKSIVEQRKKQIQKREERIKRLQEGGLSEDVSAFKDKNGKQIEIGQRFNINKDGRDYDAKVVGGDEEKLVLQSNFENEEGQKKIRLFYVDKNKVKDLEPKIEK